MGYSIILLDESLDKLKAYDPSVKLYYDLATYQDEKGSTPMMTFDVKKRKEQKEYFNKNYKNWIKSYDFAIDIDNKDLKKSWEEAKVIKEIFDNYQLPYSLRFSGTKGFHFVIDHKFISLRNRPIKLPEIFLRVVTNLMKDENLESIDTSIYDARRILKLAYSLCNNNGEEYVCLPLSDSQFNNFRYEDMKLDNVMRTVKFFKRGLLERNFGLTEKQLRDNVVRFIKEYK